MHSLSFSPQVFFSIFLAFQAVKPAWAAPEIEVPQSEEQCIAPYQFIELQGRDTGLAADGYGSSSAVLGAYERISPDGRFVLRSYSGRRLGDVAIVELPAPDPAAPVQHIVRSYATPLNNEAFPVQGSWRYLVNPDGSHYALADVLQKGAAAQPLFTGGMTGFYAAAAEVDEKDGSKDGIVLIRSLSWPVGDGLYAQGQGSLQVRTISVDTQKNRVVADSGRQILCRERRREDGSMYALPMISADGQEFSAMPQNPVRGQPTMRVFGFGAGGKSCELHETFHNASGKTIFGFRRSDAPPQVQGQVQGGDLAFEAGGQIWWHSRILGDSWPLTPPLSLISESQGEWMPSAFPGITRDGRVIYGATWQNCTQRPCQRRVGYIVADPYQNPGFRQALQTVRMTRLPPACITVADVQGERQRFAAARAIASP